jgi:hypothetical protein
MPFTMALILEAGATNLNRRLDVWGVGALTGVCRANSYTSAIERLRANLKKIALFLGRLMIAIRHRKLALDAGLAEQARQVCHPRLGQVAYFAIVGELFFNQSALAQAHGVGQVGHEYALFGILGAFKRTYLAGAI